MNNISLNSIKHIFRKIQKNLTKRFKNNFKCLILYGSWAKGTAREYSDIDLLVVFDKIDREVRKSVSDITRKVNTEKSITIVSCNAEDFQKEKLPLYTAVKKEGKIIYGNVDLSINPELPEVKYAEFFKKSYEYESGKIETAEDLLKHNLNSGIDDLCLVASKHALQAALAMKGEGYSSKVAVLLPLTEKHFGKRIAQQFKKLFDLYVKSEYTVKELSNKEARTAIKYAKEIQKVYLVRNKSPQETTRALSGNF